MTEGVPNSPLLTDLYQLTMMQAYLERGMTETAVFEFFVRKLPETRRFLLAAGLAQVVEFLQELRVSDSDLAWLERSGHANDRLLDYLAGLRFDGDVDAMSEGSVFFADEPILRITAPLPVAQLVESRIINLLHFETLIASKAARIRLAAADHLLVDFGMRRAHGAEAGMLAARAAYLAGFEGSATVLAGKEFGIPLYGTMAHSFVLAHDDELGSFEDFARVHPDKTVLLIDTYDTLDGAHKVVEVAARLRDAGIKVRGVRLDSGNLDALSREVRGVLDAGGLRDVTIFASGNLDEYAVQALRADGAPVDGFGVGTRMDVSSDAPYLDCAYKLQEYAGRARRKRSEGKATWPGRKQVYRRYDAKGRMEGDCITLENAPVQGEPLLQPVMRGGELIAPLPNLEESREYALTQLGRLPPALRELAPRPSPYPVEIGAELDALARRLDSAA
ncbi:MAG: nicotinate phosphoribosyltransferase [Acidihalobacter sp.]